MSETDWLRAHDAWSKRALAAEAKIYLLAKALEDVVRDINDYERVNNLAPNPGRTECWDSVARAKDLLAVVGNVPQP
jgi:hypothetical protein